MRPQRLLLDGAEIVDLHFEPPDLELWLENVRWLGVVFAGPLRVHGLRGVASHEPRCVPDAFPFQAPLSIVRAWWGRDMLELACCQPTGPGEAVEPTYRLGFARVTHALRPSVGRSVRAWAGFYPLRCDRSRHYAGNVRVSVASLNGAIAPEAESDWVREANERAAQRAADRPKR